MSVRSADAESHVTEITADTEKQSKIHGYYYSYFIFYLTVMIGISVFTVATRYIYHSNGYHDIIFNGASIDYSFGIFTFSYEMSDSGDDIINQVYPSSLQTVTYESACSNTMFSTDTNNGQIIDLSFFCPHSSLWYLVQ